MYTSSLSPPPCKGRGGEEGGKGVYRKGEEGGGGRKGGGEKEEGVGKGKKGEG